MAVAKTMNYNYKHKCECEHTNTTVNMCVLHFKNQPMLKDKKLCPVKFTFVGLS